MSVRVRFAPSPTGALHIGGLRTALYNYLFAKKNGGTFIVRVEDTDQGRFVEGAEDYIIKSLAWAGITPDEGPVNGGEFAPYRQSDRKGIYGKYAQHLIDEGSAYYAFDTPEELDEMRVRLKEARMANPQYNAVSRNQMKNSLTLSAEELELRLSRGEPYVIRFKMPKHDDVRFKDIVRDWVAVSTSTLDDKVLMKSDGMPTYHLANIVDDHLMKITHVIRGEEWLPSAPLHILLYKAFGWEAPQFAHLPLLLKPDGNGKLSKRAADQLGFPIFPMNWADPQSGEVSMGFMETGYLKDAFINFLVMLGWNPGTEQEIFTFDELISSFSLERINKSGAKFDIDKAKWFNQQYLKNRPSQELASQLKQEHNLTIDDQKLIAIVDSMKERVVFLGDIIEQGDFFFTAPTQFDETTAQKKWNSEVAGVLSAFAQRLKQLESIEPMDAKNLLIGILEIRGMGLGKVMPGLRLALTGANGGPDLMEIIVILGPKEAANRIDYAVKTITN
ncbi:MAG: glutamyl-tRNA synthetase [Roseivirga sp.]|jgi:glutamyl-tRNA synthetase